MPLTVNQEKLVVENIRLSYHVANRYDSEFYSKEDLAGFGMCGLINASKKFDPGLGYKFSTLAVFSIRNEIYRVLGKKRLLTTSLDVPLEDGSDYSFVDLLPSEYVDPSSYIDLHNAIQRLNDREQFIIKRCFSFDDEYLTLTEIGEVLGISRTRVGQLKEQALLKLKSYLERRVR